MRRPYVVSKGAAADLRDITKYTVAKWGQAQCRAYSAELERAAEAVAKGEGVFKDTGQQAASLQLHRGQHSLQRGIEQFDADVQRAQPGRRPPRADSAVAAAQQRQAHPADAITIKGQAGDPEVAGQHGLAAALADRDRTTQ